MAVWTIADLHLAFGNPSKSMEVFGLKWKDYPQKIALHWKKHVQESDLVLIPGDISWAMKFTDALIDLDWIDQLPGEKLIIRGNHDYWWPSSAKLKKALPPSIHFIHNTAFNWNHCTFGGARLWDSSEYNFDSYIEFVKNPLEKKKTEEELEKQKLFNEKIFARELERLTFSLQQLDPKKNTRIALTHYPPIGPDLKPTKASKILEDYQIDICVFGHLHNVKDKSLEFGTARGVKYIFSSCDYLDFTPVKVLE